MRTGQMSSQAAHSDGRVGELALALVPHQRRQHRADRPAVDPVVGVAADLAVDGADVLACAAADAAQHILVLEFAIARRPLSTSTRCCSSVRRLVRRRGPRQRDVRRLGWPVPGPSGAARAPPGRRTAVRRARSPSAHVDAGSVVVIRALPSFVTSTTVPVSTTPKFAPVIPRPPGRTTRGARSGPTPSASPARRSSRPATRLSDCRTCSRFRWIAGR